MFSAKGINFWQSKNHINNYVVKHLKILVKITTQVDWLKSNLLPKISAYETHIYLKTECLLTNWI